MPAVVVVVFVVVVVAVVVAAAVVVAVDIAAAGSAVGTGVAVAVVVVAPVLELEVLGSAELFESVRDETEDTWSGSFLQMCLVAPLQNGHIES